MKETDLKEKVCIVTGAGGLIGSEAVRFFSTKFDYVYGIDNDMRKYFFGENSSVSDSIDNIMNSCDNFCNFNYDIRDREKLEEIAIFIKNRNQVIDMVVHAAAQPSHDWAANEPHTDFGINALGTLNMLEFTRKYASHATFIFTSTNKVYGDTPNKLSLLEENTRYENYRRQISTPYSRHISTETYKLGSIDENMNIDNSKHSIFGASKVAADVMVQEYGKYFGMNTVCFRGGCLTGPNHQGAELHGFLSYLVKCIVHNKPYTIFGYKGKQVRDNIHSSDLIQMFWCYHNKPRPGEVYNAGGGRENSISMLEAISMTNEIAMMIDSSREEWKNYTISEKPREGDHMWYISDLTKFKTHYPEWKGITISVSEILRQITEKEMSKL